jgi:hypothetical protein
VVPPGCASVFVAESKTRPAASRTDGAGGDHAGGRGRAADPETPSSSTRAGARGPRSRSSAQPGATRFTS